jgi:hypothetical protein
MYEIPIVLPLQFATNSKGVEFNGEVYSIFLEFSTIKQKESPGDARAIRGILVT